MIDNVWLYLALFHVLRSKYLIFNMSLSKRRKQTFYLKDSKQKWEYADKGYGTIPFIQFENCIMIVISIHVISKQGNYSHLARKTRFRNLRALKLVNIIILHLPFRHNNSLLDYPLAQETMVLLCTWNFKHRCLVIFEYIVSGF